MDKAVARIATWMKITYLVTEKKFYLKRIKTGAVIFKTSGERGKNGKFLKIIKHHADTTTLENGRKKQITISSYQLVKKCTVLPNQLKLF